MIARVDMEGPSEGPYFLVSISVFPFVVHLATYPFEIEAVKRELFIHSFSTEYGIV
jgi:hypothetical protein